jgi:tRNA-Thr(GGU) m(6)t(6)A37 methyltransferase TsaA
METERFSFQPIGVIHSPFKQPSGVPIQGAFAPEAQGYVEIDDAFSEGLQDIEQFSHIYLLYMFHRNQQVKLTVTPFLDNQPHGVLATRAPCRPNPIGLSIVRLLAREGNRLHVGELDIIDETPLLDLKPYIPRFDHRPDAAPGWTAGAESRDVTYKADDRFQS